MNQQNEERRERGEAKAMDIDLDKPLLTTEDLADFLGTTPGAVRAMCAKGNGPRRVKGVARGNRFDPADIAEWIETKKTKGAKNG